MSSLIDRLAQEFNVSNATVSRALNDKPGVGRVLREKIMARAREIDYIPNFTARSLANSKTYTIGYFVREKPGLAPHQDPFYYEIQHGVEQVAAKTDYHLSVATLTDDILDKPTDFRFVREKRVDGIILAGPDIPNDFVMAMLKTQTPVVIVDNRLHQTPVNCVNSDDEGGAYSAARHLIELGHKRIGVLAGPSTWSSSARRIRGYQRAMMEASLELPIIVHQARTTVDSGEAAFHTLYSHIPDITAVCAVNDSMAIGAIRAASVYGRLVPDHLSVVGFDDIAWAAINTPPLTTVNIPKVQIGKEAAMRLMALLNDPELIPSEVTVPVQLIERNSTRMLRG
jgi:LacI family transcriptional regulator